MKNFTNNVINVNKSGWVNEFVKAFMGEAIDDIGVDNFTYDNFSSIVAKNVMLVGDVIIHDDMLVIDSINYLNERSKFPFIHTKSTNMVFDGRCWNIVNNSDMRNLIEKISSCFVSNVFVGKKKCPSVPTLISRGLYVYYDIEQPEEGTTMICFQNGVVELVLSDNDIDINIHGHSPKFPCYNVVDADIDIDMMERVRKTGKLNISDDILSVIYYAINERQREKAFSILMAYPILKLLGIKMQYIPFLHGEAGCGKSTVLKAIGSMFGSSTAFRNLDEVINDETKRHQLIGKYLMISEDVQGKNLSSSSFNTWVNGDFVQCRQRYKDSVDMKPIPTMCASNTLPRSFDNEGLSRRCYVIECVRSERRITGCREIDKLMRKYTFELFLISLMYARNMVIEGVPLSYEEVNDEKALEIKEELDIANNPVRSFVEYNLERMINVAKMNGNIVLKSIVADMWTEHIRKHHNGYGGSFQPTKMMNQCKDLREIFEFKMSKSATRPAHFRLLVDKLYNL